MLIPTRAASAMLLALLMGGVPPSLRAQGLEKLPEAAGEEAKKWAVVFDFDTDSCYPSPAISASGQLNPGLSVTGIDTSFVSGCRDARQLENSNTYHRAASIRKDGKLYVVHMYALYFMKDKDLPLNQAEGAGGHRHDWEFALVWMENGVLTHASYSAHGGVTTHAAATLHLDSGARDHVKIVYHKNSISTHAMRFADANEQAENDQPQWVTPTIVTGINAKRGSRQRRASRKAQCPLIRRGELFGERPCFSARDQQKSTSRLSVGGSMETRGVRIPSELLNRRERRS